MSEVKVSNRENMLRMHRGETPAFLPRSNFQHVKCSYFEDIKAPGDHIDEFGVEYIGRMDIFGGAPIPKPGKYVLHDITKWRDVIKAPTMEDADWEQLAKTDLAPVNAEENGVIFYTGKIFQRLTDFMGFEEGLCAIMEEPEEVYALFDHLCCFYEKLLKNFIPHYKPDAICIPDDTATARAPFISPQVYRELVKPFHKRIADLALNAGVFVEMHDCGRCEDFVDDWMDFGICGWNPAQPSNDLKAIKAKYGNRLFIEGGWDTQGPLSSAAIDEDVLRAELENYVNTLAPDGGFIFSVFLSGKMDDPETKRKNGIVNDFYNEQRAKWYQ